MGFSQATWFDTSIRALFIYYYYYYYYYNYYWPNIASKKEKPLLNSWSQNYFFFLAKQNKPKFTIRKWSSKKKQFGTFMNLLVYLVVRALATMSEGSLY